MGVGERTLPAPGMPSRRRDRRAALDRLEVARPPWKSAENRPELNKTRRVTLGLPHKYVALVRSWAGSKKGKVPKRGEGDYAAPGRDVSVRRELLFLIYLRTATRGSVDQQKCNSFRRKTGSFLASGPGRRKGAPPIGRSGPRGPFPG